MRRAALAITATALLLSPTRGSAAEPHWIRLESTNFEIYSSSGPGTARDALRYLEQVRSFFVQVLGHGPARPVPVRIVAFGSAREFEPYRLNEFAAAYYQPSSRRDTIVMGPGSADTFSTVIHEYVHLIVEHGNMHLPPWLNEGLAELYSTLQPRADKILVGSLIPGRFQALLQDKWVPLPIILAAGHDSPYYNEKNKAGSLYNEGWALTHMLVLRAEYRPGFAGLAAEVSGGTDSAAALQKIYGKTVAQVEKDLQVYLRGGSFQGMLVPVKLAQSVERSASEPVPPFDVKLVLAQILNRRGREEQARERFEALAKEDPKRPEPHAELGYVEWYQGHLDRARAEFESAYRLGERGARFLWDYGRMAERGGAGQSLPVLRQLLEAEPDRLEVRMEIAEVQLRARQPAAAAETLQPVRKVGKSDAPRFFRILALAELESGNRTEARAAAEKLKEFAANDGDRQEADRLLALADRPPGAVVRAEEPPPLGEPGGDGAPRLRRPAPPPPREETPPPPPRPSVSGRFVALDCSGKQAKLAVQTDAGRKVLLIEDPARIYVASANGGPVDLACGPQAKPADVTVEYDAPGTSAAGVDGIVRSIEFR